jgi:F-type H+-transporting ATPase subunit b
MMQTRNILRACLLLLAISFAGSARSLYAQEQTAAPQQEQPEDSSAKKPKSLPQQMVHETREAAGEEKDDKAQFRESPSVKFIARHTGLSLGTAYLLSVLLNFAVIAGIIFWAGRKYLPAAFRDRTAGIQKAMQEAQAASAEARRKLAEIESRLAKLDVEIGAMRDTAEREATAEAARIQAAAEEDARKIVQAAQQEIAAAAKAARRDLTAYAAHLAVALAQKQIHVDAATDEALVRNFAGQLNAAPDGPGKGGN